MKKIIQWYFDTFLPYENPNHPLHCPKQTQPDDDWYPDFSYPIALRHLEQDNMDIYAPLKAETDEEALALLDIPSLTVEELEDLAWFYCHTQGSSNGPITEREDFLANKLLDRLEELELGLS